MAITALTDPASLPDQSKDQDVFDAAMAAMIRDLPLRAQQENELAANLNAIAAGGAYAIATTWGALQASGGASQSTMTALLSGFTDAKGQNIVAQLNYFGSSTSARKGTIRLIRQNDASKFLLMDVLSSAQGSTFQTIGVAVIDASSVNPFANGDSLMLYFQRTGDRGSDGNLPTLQMIKVSDQKAAGVPGGARSAGGVDFRTFNTIEKNTISGATLTNGNTVTLPAGTYRYRGRAPANNVGLHRCWLADFAGNVLAYGSGANTGSNGQSDSFVSGFLTLSTTTSIRLPHATTNDNGSLSLGINQSGGVSTFSELEFEKLL